MKTINIFEEHAFEFYKVIYINNIAKLATSYMSRKTKDCYVKTSDGLVKVDEVGSSETTSGEALTHVKINGKWEHAQKNHIISVLGYMTNRLDERFFIQKNHISFTKNVSDDGRTARLKKNCEAYYAHKYKIEDWQK